MPRHPHFLWTNLFRTSRSHPKDKLIDVLESTILFKDLSRKELRYLSNFVYERVYQPNEPIFGKNDRASGLYIVASGRVAIRTQETGAESLTTILGKNSFFGELSLILPNSLRNVSAQSVNRSELIGFFEPELKEILQRRPQTGVKILGHLSEVLGRRLLETTERLMVLSKARGETQVNEDYL